MMTVVAIARWMSKSIIICCLSFMSVAQPLVELKNEQYTALIKPLGAELQSLKSNLTGKEYIWQGDAKYWARRAPIMFPVNVRFKGNHFTYQGKEYEMPTLGLVHTRALSVTQHDQQNVSFTLKSNEETLKNYPFNFKFTLTYRLLGDQLIHEFTIDNIGDNTMYFALGGHPGFVLSDEKGKARKDYVVTFSSIMNTTRPLLSGGLVQDTLLPFLKNEHFLALEDKRVPNHGMLILNNTAKRMGVAQKGKAPFVEVIFGNFPNVNLWSPVGMPFVAIEPQVGHHDFENTVLDITKKTYLTALAAKQTKHYQFSIQVNED